MGEQRRWDPEERPVPGRRRCTCCGTATRQRDLEEYMGGQLLCPQCVATGGDEAPRDDAADGGGERWEG